jgi:hypothetical protein
MHRQPKTKEKKRTRTRNTDNGKFVSGFSMPPSTPLEPEDTDDFFSQVNTPQGFRSPVLAVATHGQARQSSRLAQVNKSLFLVLCTLLLPIYTV